MTVARDSLLAFLEGHQEDVRRNVVKFSEILT